MKGNKKILVVAVLLLLIAVSYSTYAIYKSEATGTGSVTPAAWVVTVQSGSQTAADIVQTNTFTLDDITWTGTRYAQVNGKIAPGDTGTVSIKIDADGSEVGVSYAIEVDQTALTNDHISVAPHSGSSLTGNIAYSATAGAMETTVTLDVKWLGEDETSQNAEDVATATAGTAMSIPIKVTVTQNPNPDA